MNRFTLLLAMALFPCAARAQQFDLPAGSVSLEPRGASAGETGQVRWYELVANGRDRVTLKAPDDLAASIDLTWFSALPGGSAVAVCVDSTGLMTTGCAARLSAVQTWTATQTMRDINPSADSTYNIGNGAARYSGIYSDVAHTELVAFRYQGSAATNFSMGTLLPGTDVRLYDAFGSEIMLWDATRVFTYKDFRPITASSLKLGDAILPWSNVYGDVYQVNTSVLPDTSAGASLGSATLRFLGHFDDVTMYNNPVLKVDLSNSGTIGTGTAIWGGVFSGALYLGVSASVSGILDMRNGSTAGAASLRTSNLSGAVDFETQDHLYPNASGTLDLGASTRRWRKIWLTDLDISGALTAPSGSGGATATLACGAGQAVKNITVSGGIVTAVSCGTP